MVSVLWTLLVIAAVLTAAAAALIARAAKEAASEGQTRATPADRVEFVEAQLAVLTDRLNAIERLRRVQTASERRAVRRLAAATRAAAREVASNAVDISNLEREPNVEEVGTSIDWDRELATITPPQPQ